MKNPGKKIRILSTRGRDAWSTCDGVMHTTHTTHQHRCSVSQAGPAARASVLYIQHTSTMHIARALAASMPLVLPRNQAFTQPFSLWLLHPSAFTSVQTNGCPHRLAVKQLRASALWLLANRQSFTSRCAAHGLSVFHLKRRINPTLLQYKDIEVKWLSHPHLKQG